MWSKKYNISISMKWKHTSTNTSKLYSTWVNVLTVVIFCERHNSNPAWITPKWNLRSVFVLKDYMFHFWTISLLRPFNSKFGLGVSARITKSNIKFLLLVFQWSEQMWDRYFCSCSIWNIKVGGWTRWWLLLICFDILMLFSLTATWVLMRFIHLVVL